MRMKRAVRTIQISCLLFLLLAAFCGCSRLGGHAVRPTDQRAKRIQQTKRDGPVQAASSPEAFSHKQKFGEKTPVLTINGAHVYWPEFHFWLNYIAKYYKKYHHLKVITDWEAKQNGMQLADFFRTTAAAYARKDRAIAAQAEALGIDLSESDRAQIEKEKQSKIRIYGRLQYQRIVRRMYLSEAVFDYLTRIDYLARYLFAHYFGDRGEKCTDAQVRQYVAQKGFMCTKYIFLSNFDRRRHLLSPQALTQNDNRLRQLLDQLDAHDNVPARFDVLMDTYGEDPEILRYPDGRLIAPGEMGTEFERAYSALKVHEYSAIVKNAQGSYIILRMPIFPEMAADAAGNSLRYRTAFDYMFKKRIKAWSDQMVVVYQQAYDQIDVERILKR